MQKENKTRFENRQVRFLPAVRLLSPANQPRFSGDMLGTEGSGEAVSRQSLLIVEEKTGVGRVGGVEDGMLTHLITLGLPSAQAGTSLLSFVYTALTSALRLLPNPGLPGSLVQTSNLRHLSHLRAHVPSIR